MVTTGMIPLHYWLVLSSAFFSIGLYGYLTRRSAVGILVSIEILLNSAVLNFVIFNSYTNSVKMDGQIMAILIIALAACEVVILFAILLALYRQKHTVNITKLTDLKG